MIDLKKTVGSLKTIFHSKNGQNTLMFLVFLAISAVLWSVQTFNEEEQCDVRMPIAITQIPDSVTLITNLPKALSVSLKAKGSQRIKLAWTEAPTLNIDFRAYRTRNGVIHLDDAELKALVRNAFGGSTVQIVSPDSLNIVYTNHPGVKVPIQIDCNATAGPKSALVGRPHASVDSVAVYYAGRIGNIESVSTEALRLPGLGETVTRRVRLIAPSGSRVIPDSIDVTVEVEPLIMKTRKVVIEPVNVPTGVKLITFPAQIDVMYMVPMSVYKKSDPHIRVIADYRYIDFYSSSKMMKLRLRDVPEDLQNVHLSADSAEYIIEKL
jgi:hypothetical protein